jgi:hypothetical protein
MDTKPVHVMDSLTTNIKYTNGLSCRLVFTEVHQWNRYSHNGVNVVGHGGNT